MSERREKASNRARFGGFELDLRTGELTREGRTIRLTDRPLEVLTSLLERSGDLVTREELQERLWGDDTFVDFDNNLNATVSRLREALDDSAQNPGLIETVPRKGYRYVGPSVTWSAPSAAETPEKSGSSALGRRIGLAALLGLLLVALLLWIRSTSTESGDRATDPAPSTARLMLAVLPFENLSEDPHQEYLADGLTEELIARLGGVAPARLGVIARTSVRRYKQTEKTIEEIGAELGVDYVVEGSVRVQSDRVRVTAQLIRVSDQTHAWAEVYERATDDILAIQNDIAVRVAGAVLPHLLLPEEPLPVGGGTLDPEAFDEYLRGLFELAQNDVEPSRRAIEHFESALEGDPDFAQAWAALAEAHNLVYFGASSEVEAAQTSRAAREAAGRAIELDPSVPDAYLALAFARLYHDWDPVGAGEALDPVLERPVSRAAALQLAAAALAAQGRLSEALAAAAEGRVLDPASSAGGTLLGWYQLFAGRPAEAERTCREVLDRDPESSSAAECYYQALLGAGRGMEAVRFQGRRLIAAGVPAERFEPVDPEDPELAVPELERIRLEWIFAERSDDPNAPFDAATAFTRVGELDRAFAGLEMALESKDVRMLYLAVDPRFESLRSDPRFDDLLARVRTREAPESGG